MGGESDVAVRPVALSPIPGLSQTARKDTAKMSE